MKNGDILCIADFDNKQKSLHCVVVVVVYWKIAKDCIIVNNNITNVIAK